MDASQHSTAERILASALARFAQFGYEGTSLTDIATDVGIRKPSIYAHFKSKDALYLRLVASSLEAELAHARDTLRGGADIRRQLRGYLNDTGDRFRDSPRTRFCLQALFLPPQHLFNEPAFDALHDYMHQLEQIILLAMKNSPLRAGRGSLAPASLAIAYLGLIEAVQSELLYGGAEKFQRMARASWSVFEIALDRIEGG